MDPGRDGIRWEADVGQRDLTLTTATLRQTVAAGCTLHYHGDFDWGGIRIGNVLHERVPFTPWRYDTAAYLATDAGHPLTGTPVEARWDPALASTMSRAGHRIEEEHVLDTLLSDLVSA